MLGPLYEFLRMFNIAESDMCSAIIQRTHGCASSQHFLCCWQRLNFTSTRTRGTHFCVFVGIMVLRYTYMGPLVLWWQHGWVYVWWCSDRAQCVYPWLDCLVPKRSSKPFRKSCNCIPIYTASHPGALVPSRCSQLYVISTSEWQDSNLKPVVTVLFSYPYPFIIHDNPTVRNLM